MIMGINLHHIVFPNYDEREEKKQGEKMRREKIPIPKPNHQIKTKFYPKIFEISSLNLLPLRWGRKKVGVDKRNLVPPPLYPCLRQAGPPAKGGPLHTLDTEGR
jgi:hypothetical protein